MRCDNAFASYTFTSLQQVSLTLRLLQEADSGDESARDYASEATWSRFIEVATCASHQLQQDDTPALLTGCFLQGRCSSALNTITRSGGIVHSKQMSLDKASGLVMVTLLVQWGSGPCLKIRSSLWELNLLLLTLLGVNVPNTMEPF